MMVSGDAVSGGQFLVNRYHLLDKHGTARTVYNAKLNIHRGEAAPIFLGMRSEDLRGFTASKVESPRRDPPAARTRRRPAAWRRQPPRGVVMPVARRISGRD